LLIIEIEQDSPIFSVILAVVLKNGGQVRLIVCRSTVNPNGNRLWEGASIQKAKFTLIAKLVAGRQ
jgi:hypothetical protein